MAPFFALHLPSFSFADRPDGEIFDRVVEQARAAEAVGFDLVTVMDHFYQIGSVGSEEEPMLEAYTLLGALAAQTSRVRLSTMVTGVTYRNPATLAKQVTTLDVISHGRAVLGLGAAWNESEHLGYGYEFPPIGERMNRLEEALEIARLMFTEERPSFEGRYYRIEGALNRPRPLQEGGPPILVGGSGERRTLRAAARYANLTNWMGGSLDDLRHKNEVLERHCEAVGRDSSTITRTMLAPVVLVEREADAPAVDEKIPPRFRGSLRAATPEQAAELLEPYVAEGFSGFFFRNAQYSTPDAIQLVGELIKLVR
jgi:F420-dependent oxidoreductase-like protein